jgi:hypothetical protein
MFFVLFLSYPTIQSLRTSAVGSIVGAPKCAMNSVSKALAKVNSARSNPRLVIALHSPNALPETGLRMRLPEKSRGSTASDAEQSVL